MTDSINVSSGDLVECLYFVIVNDETLRYICNHCTEKEVVFFEGDVMLSTHDDYLAIAATHLVAEHPEQIGKR